jgi:hypothetical protein
MKRIFSGEGFVGAMLVILIALFLIAPAYAGGDKGCPYGHEHQGSCGGEQGPPGEDGKDGKDGKDGIDGRDGKDGKDGRDGIDGINGIDGRDGVVSETWIKETRHNFREWGHYAAAMQAIQIHLPQDRGSRLTLAGSTINGVEGLGLGYAYKMDRDDNLAFTVGVGSSGGEEVGVASVGFEFGGDRNALRNTQHYDDSRFERRLDALEQDFQRQKSLWDEDAKRCAADLDQAELRSDRIEEQFMECLRK